MKYCIEFTLDFQYKDEIDEYLIKYTGKDDKVFEFLEYAENKRVVIEFNEENFKEFILNKSYSKYAEIENKNFTLKLPLYSTIIAVKDVVDKLKELNIPFCFADAISSIDVLHGFLDMGVTDVYISGDLAFELDHISDIVHEKGALIRVYPNVAQSQWSETEDLKSFFIRPEDEVFYDRCVDIYEFYGDKKLNNFYYKIYAIKKEWFGELSEIIINFEEELDSRNVTEWFGEKRRRCGKRCMKDRACHICDLSRQFDKTLKANAQMLTKK